MIREAVVNDLPDGPFDFILSSHTFEHVPDDRNAAPGDLSAAQALGIVFFARTHRRAELHPVSCPQLLLGVDCGTCGVVQF